MYYLANQFTTLPDNEKDNVKAVVIDMWETYKDLTKRFFKHAIIAVDSFHVIRHLNDSLIKIRIKVMMKFYHQTSKLVHNEMYYYMLKKFHYFFVKNFEDIYDGDIKIPKINAKWKKQAILKYLLSIDDDLKYAYLLKEKYREFNATANYDSSNQEFDALIYEFSNSHLSEMRDFGKLLLHWKTEIRNSFIRIDKRRLSNGVIEGINSRIKTIIKNANGYNNFNRLRNKIMYSLNINEPILNSPKKID
jgi:transposase